ncbi:unnamed protein product [Ilex paraguariensis]|uniref:Uncharacterized protein n=1 Tax=Ilex paraguariensis TaxID=185542 RepID=A0ABC8UAJ2_9AQUA
MEAVLLRSSPEHQPTSPYNYKQHMGNSRNNRPFISRSSENYPPPLPPNFQGGLLLPPPAFLTHSFPPPFSVFNPRQQPPLLPLPHPTPKPYHTNNCLTRGLSCPPINRKIDNNRSRDKSRTPKKSKVSTTTSPKKEEPKLKHQHSKSTKVTTTLSSPECFIIESTNRLGPEPKDLPKDVSRVLSLSSSSSSARTIDTTGDITLTTTEQLDKFSDSTVFTISPPPSSLPLPTFCLRPKLGFNQVSMEAVLLRSSPEHQPTSPYNYKQHMGNSRNNRPFISRSSENYPPPLPPNFQGGLLLPPPAFLTHSFPPPFSVFNPRQQPPLLPLPHPTPKPYHTNNCLTRGLSCPPINRKIDNNRSRDKSRTPKKSKVSTTTSPKKEEPKLKHQHSKSTKVTTTLSSPECFIIESTNRLGPEPKDLPKDVSRVLSLSSSSSSARTIDTTGDITLTTTEQLDKFSDSTVFTISPPPSSLPLPTFCLRPKLGCNAEAAGVDSGATDSLRRLLRLR